MSDATLPSLPADAIGTVSTGRELGWQRWRDRWGVPLFLACLPMLLLILSGELAAGLQELGSANRAWHRPAEPSLTGRLLEVSRDLQPRVAPGMQPHELPTLERKFRPLLRPTETTQAALAMLAYLVVSVFGLRMALRDCYPQTWMGLTRSEQDEFEVLAASSEAVEVLRTRVAAMPRELVVQDLVQARAIARLTARQASWPARWTSQRPSQPHMAAKPASLATGLGHGARPARRPAR